MFGVAGCFEFLVRGSVGVGVYGLYTVLVGVLGVWEGCFFLWCGGVDFWLLYPLVCVWGFWGGAESVVMAVVSLKCYLIGILFGCL